MDNILLLNTIRANASNFYKERIPVATRTNLESVGSKIACYQPTMNEFAKLLVNKICMTIIENKVIKNPLNILKHGEVIPYGKNIEEVFVNPSTAKEYSLTSEDLLKSCPPDIKALYYTMNRRDKYCVSIAQPELQGAVCSASKLSELIDRIVNSLYSGDNLDEFTLTKQLVATAFKNDHIKKIEVDYNSQNMTKENSSNLIKMLKGTSLGMTFASSDYNSYDKIKPSEDKGKSVITFTPQDRQVILLDSWVYTSLSVDVLASAFNMSEVQFESQVIPVDNFNGEPILAMICDKSWFRIFDSVSILKDFDNGDTLEMKYWWHRWETFAYNMFSNAVAISTKQTTV